MNRPKSAEDYILSQEKWGEILNTLREIILSTELEETIKWGIPTYTVNKKNVVGLAAFKNYAGLWFFNGVYLMDEAKHLINAEEGNTKALRQWRFETLDQLNPDLIKAYLEEAIQNQKDGIELKPQKKTQVNSELLQQELNNSPKLQLCFNSFSEAKQQEFIRHIKEAKREDTKRNRIEKIKPLILAKVSLNDKYRPK